MEIVRYEVKLFRGENGSVNIDVQVDGGDNVFSLFIEGGDYEIDLPPVELVQAFDAPEVEIEGRR